MASQIVPFPCLSEGKGTELFQKIPHPTPGTLLNGGDRRKIILTTVKIPDEQIWANGLFQNIYILYKLMEVLGYEPYLMVDSMENNKDANIHKNFRMVDFKTYIHAPFPVTAYLEFGMSCDPMIRKFFRNTGAKVAKTYLGNILNIDIETITFYPTTNFSHHVAGETDEIWVSPHYDFHADYAGSINGLCGRVRIAPYVWEPYFIRDLGRNVYKEPESKGARQFIIMEPNISFQKSSFMSIMAIEAFYRRHPEQVKECVVVNGARLEAIPYFKNSVLPFLTIFKNGKLKLMPRAHMNNLARVFNDAIFIQHQVNNEYNYSFLELMAMGFPVVHNYGRLKEFGYYYDRNNFDAAADQIENVIQHHAKNTEQYASQVEQLLWRFSIYNPENLEGWKQLVTQQSPPLVA